MKLFSRSSKPSSSKAANFPYDTTLDQSRAAQQTTARGEKRDPIDTKTNPFEEPPPQYTPTDTSAKHWSISEKDLAVLRNYDTIFIIDDSGSMLQDDSDPDDPKGKATQTLRTRWDKARDALEAVVTMAMQNDGNGVDIHFLNSQEWRENCRSERDVMELFSRVIPRGKTPTGRVLRQLVTPYIKSITPWNEKTDEKSHPKPRNYIVITDGRSTDPEDSRLKDVILEFTRSLDEGRVPLNQLGIQFLQVGDAEDASEALKELDGDLRGRVRRGEIRDIVDTIPFDHLQGDINESHIIKVLVGSINKRIDETHHFEM